MIKRSVEPTFQAFGTTVIRMYKAHGLSQKTFRQRCGIGMPQLRLLLQAPLWTSSTIAASWPHSAPFAFRSGSWRPFARLPRCFWSNITHHPSPIKHLTRSRGCMVKQRNELLEQREERQLFVRARTTGACSHCRATEKSTKLSLFGLFQVVTKIYKLT